jgi:hypothetical protein
MTAGTGNKLVLSHQWKIGLCMVEVIQLLDLQKTHFGMALTAILPEFVIMNILVATCTICKRYTGKFLHFYPIMEGYLMTFYTFSIGMFSAQSEPGFLMIKF